MGAETVPILKLRCTYRKYEYFGKESSKSRTYILLLSEISWGAVFKKLRLSISYRNVQARGHFISDPNDPVQPPLSSGHVILHKIPLPISMKPRMRIRHFFQQCHVVSINLITVSSGKQFVKDTDTDSIINTSSTKSQDAPSQE